MIVEVTDANGQKALFQTVVIVDGVTSVDLSRTGTLSQRCQLDAACIFQNQIVDGVNQVLACVYWRRYYFHMFLDWQEVVVRRILSKSVH